MVCLEFRPIIGSVTTPLSLPLSKKEEERRQAVPTCPGWASPWTTCSLRSSCEQRNATAVLLLPSEFVCVNHGYKLLLFFQKWVNGRQNSHECYLKELQGELEVVWVHGVDAVLRPLGGLQCIATLRLWVAWLITTGTDHTDLQGGGHLLQRWRTELFFILILLLYAF